MKEHIKTIFENKKIKVEEIISGAAASPAGFWYDNREDEWVCVTAGNAALEFENGEVVLNAGESYYIDAHIKHRVKYASPDCIWLCVYVK